MNAITPTSRLHQSTPIQQLATTMIDHLDRAESAGRQADSLPSGSHDHDLADSERDDLYMAAFELRRAILKLRPADLTDAAILVLALTLEMDVLNDDAGSAPNIGRETFVNVALGMLLALRAAGAEVPEGLKRHFLTQDLTARLQALEVDQHAA